jgi:hypothetical protein
MKVRKNIAMNEEGFIFNPSTGDSFSTNILGVEIISVLKNDLTFNEITELVCKKYDVDKTAFEKDLEEFILQLKEFNILN